jgi:nitroimidazol reductase NimA-like FMN-containing flavoprotein (pyridoxamine 5'-phosphate oxidase superfamily)
MSTSEAGPKTEILSVHDCWKYLRSASVGRVAVVKDAVPEIFPVNYLPEDGTVIFRTAPGTKLDAVLQGGTVALEADGLNDYGTIAWSVVLKGQPEAAALAGDDLSRADRDLTPWEAGVKDQLIRITPTELTGRRFVISSPQRWWQPRDAASSMD